ncbi:lytic transglycosylase domain-containing protein [uncultured Aliiroseovarius sp.]|uniref:lytic transglycosylase domain-containing protein n=1 Tax=uncultured Aliiroseovarius sp. TaxID=1658783 RepID=UPI00260BBEB6|nr:lytic transglycosylase domain-containing protein [uncultured Aliiroseovarius sp.]
MADLMVIRADGSVRTSGWNDHGRESAEHEVARLKPSHLETRHAILSAIRATSERHVANRSLLSIKLSPADWHFLFQALIEAESGYNPTAVSPKGAYGLGQLMPATAHDLGIDPTDPVQNLEGAARYLMAQIGAFRDVDLALAAYNAGPHRVRAYGGVPPFTETRDFIARIHNIRDRLSRQQTGLPGNLVSTRRSTRAPVVIALQ